jgi:hypothetical protein
MLFSTIVNCLHIINFLAILNYFILSYFWVCEAIIDYLWLLKVISPYVIISYCTLYYHSGYEWLLVIFIGGY